MPAGRRRAAGVQVHHQPLSTNLRVAAVERDGADQRDDPAVEIVDAIVAARGFRRAAHLHAAIGVDPQYLQPLARCVAIGRSEEHTSELQSLMRISYAVICLKKKKQYIHET